VISVASFFVSRVDTEADRRLEELGRADLQGKLAIANAKLAYQHYLAVFSGPRWDALAARGARPQRCLWASTSTKNPAYRDVLYVEELIGPATVNTMPFETIAAFQDHGSSRETLTEGSTRRVRFWTSSPRPASTTRTSRTRSSPRGSRSSRGRSALAPPGSTPSAPRSLPPEGGVTLTCDVNTLTASEGFEDLAGRFRVRRFRLRAKHQSVIIPADCPPEQADLAQVVREHG
jgi:hypothetical protein